MALFNRFRFILVFTLVCIGSSAAWAGVKFSAVTVDARSGAIILDEDSNGLRHPASLTKMMTLYVLFQDLRAKRVKLSTPLRVSSRAAGMAPSKLGLKAGTTITVEQAIKALVIKSANDAAATVGENLGGTESAFAQRMTRTARSIGMSRTVFKNASGLPNPAQVTTARDMATLGLRLMRDFPEYYPYFRLTSFTFRGKTIRGHNQLVGRYSGTDGIKTGYVNASGFNLVSSTKRGDKRLVGVVMGGKSASRRNRYMMTIMEKSFPKARSGNTIAAVAGSSKGVIDPLQNLKRKSDAAPAATPNAVTDAAGAAHAPDTDAMAAAAEAAAGTAEPKVLEAEISGTNQPNEDVVFAVQIGKFKSRKSAEEVVGKLNSAADDGKSSKMIRVKDKGATFYRVLVSGYSEDSAKASCARVTKIGKECRVVSPQG
jgi:D-alanyl-D-alanine carboxypeptidase